MTTTYRLLRREEVEARTGFSHNSLYRKMREGNFQLPVKVGEKAVRWPESEIQQWLADRPRATGDRSS